MAQIPLGDFGTRVAQVGPTPTAQIDNQVGNAVQRVANTGLQIAGQEINQQAAIQLQEQRRMEANDRRLQTITAETAVQTGLADTFDSIRGKVQSGEMDRISALAAWKDTSKQVVDDNTQGLDPEVTPFVRAQAGGLAGKLTNSLFDTFRVRERQDTAAVISNTTEQLQRLAVVDPAAALDRHKQLIQSLGGPAGMDPAQQAKSIQSFRETVAATGVGGSAAALYQAGDSDGLDKLNARLLGPEGEMLDPTRRNQLSTQVFGLAESIRARRRAEDEKNERREQRRFDQARDLVDKNTNLLMTGAVLSAEAITELSNATAGTTLEKRAVDLLSMQKEAAGFAGKSAAQRQASLDVLRAERIDPNRGTSVEAEKLLQRAENIDSSLRKQVDDGDAWAAYGSAGGKTFPALQLNNPQQALETFRSRLGDIGDVEAWAGKKVSPLQPTEAEAFGKILRSLQPDQASTLLGQMGDVVGNADRVAALSKQIGDKDKVMGMAMLMASTKTTMGRNTSELMLRGDQMIRDKLVKPDGMAETGWRASIAKQIRGAYSNQEAESNLIEAAFRVAAATDGDVDRAVRLTTGGIIEHNGGRIPLPAGIDERRFEKSLTMMTPANFADQAPNGQVMMGGVRVPLSEFVRSLPDARLIHAGQGVYNVRAGNTLVTNERGQRINVRIQP